MVDHDVFRLRLLKLEEYLRHLRGLGALGRDGVLGDPGHIAQMERWMHLAAEASLDLAQHLISSRGWKTPDTNRKAFRILRDEKVLTSELARQMEGWAGLRNVLVHLYLDVDHDLLYTMLTEELGQLDAYASVLKALLDEDAST